MSDQPRVFHNITIVMRCGEWFDRYSEAPPYHRQPDAVIDKRHYNAFKYEWREDGEFAVWRAEGVSDANWQVAIQALTGATAYDVRQTVGRRA